MAVFSSISAFSSVLGATLGAPGDTYIITDTRKKPRKPLDETAALKKLEVHKLDKEGLEHLKKTDPLQYEQLKSDLNKSVKTSKEQQEPTIAEMVALSQAQIKDDFVLFEDKQYLYNADRWNLRFNVTSDKVIIQLNYNNYSDNAINKSISYNIDDLRPTDFFKANKEALALTKQLIAKEPLKWFILSYSPIYKDIIDYDFDVDYKDFNLEYICDNGNEFWHGGFLATITVKKFTELLQQQIKQIFYKEDTEGRGKYYDIVLLNDIINYVLKGRQPAGKSFNNDTYNYTIIKGSSYEDGEFWAVKIPQSTLGLFSLGRTANDEIYNNLDLLEFGGMQPTYQQLPDYNQFFAPAENRNSFAGYGLDDTKTLIADICRKHYKECAPIAAHLKADTMLQSCFNLWHWLHHNIKYEYDRDDREEVRTPLRVWADRKRGVDCDCLSVFAWCVLKCMGYNPAFELVAFKGRPQYSHIFVNCDGVVVDRVWFIFNMRPPFVTKREIYKVNLTNNLGDLF